MRATDMQDLLDRVRKAEARTAKLERILTQALSALDIYDDGDGNRLVSMNDEQMLAAFDAYCEFWRSTPFNVKDGGA